MIQIDSIDGAPVNGQPSITARAFIPVGNRKVVIAERNYVQSADDLAPLNFDEVEGRLTAEVCEKVAAVFAEAEPNG